MATQGKGAAPKRKASVPVSSYSGPPVYLDASRPFEQDWWAIMGWIAALVLAGLLLPLLGMLYMDVLQTKHEAKQQIEKMEKLRKEIQQQNRDKADEP
jgi:hypothetical protein